MARAVFDVQQLAGQSCQIRLADGKVYMQLVVGLSALSIVGFAICAKTFLPHYILYQ